MLPAFSSSTRVYAASRSSTTVKKIARLHGTAVSQLSTTVMSATGYSWDKYQGQDRVVSPSAERNKQPILEELQKHLPTSGLVLEVASGTGQHITHFAAALSSSGSSSSELHWQPSDVTSELFGSISAYVADAQLKNVRPPLLLDASLPVGQWPVQEPCAAVMAANVTHISPWRVTQGLVAGAGALLQPGGLLFIYGPFKMDGAFTSDSNRQFHESLNASNPEWGYRDAADVSKEAAAAGLALQQCVAMPANNFALVFRKS